MYVVAGSHMQCSGSMGYVQGVCGRVVRMVGAASIYLRRRSSSCCSWILWSVYTTNMMKSAT